MPILLSSIMSASLSIYNDNLGNVVGLFKIATSFPGQYDPPLASWRNPKRVRETNGGSAPKLKTIASWITPGRRRVLRNCRS
jgi:hypothetical protein